MTIAELNFAPPTPLGELAGLWKFAAVSRYPGNAAQGDLSDARSRKVTFDLVKPGTCNLTINGDSGQLGWLTELRSDVIAYRWSDVAGTFVPRYRGIVNHSEDQLSAAGTHTVTIQTTDYRGMLGRQVLRNPLTYSATEQASIISGLVALGDQPPGFTGRLGISSALANPDGSPLAATGIARDRSYLRSQVVQSAIDDMSTDINGFDFSISPDPVTAALVATVWYPRRGTPRTAWVAHYGSTVTDVARVVDTSTYLSYAVSVGNQGTMFAESFGPGWLDPIANPEGSFMTSQAQNDVSVQATLQQNSDGLVALYGSVFPAYTLTLAPGRWSPDDAWVGDTVRFICRSGRLNVDTNVRITAATVDVDESGTETVRLTAGWPPATGAQLLRDIDRRLSRLERR